MGVTESVFVPWLKLCAAVTPEAWQVQGNILLGLGWLVSGVVVYSLIVGALVAAVLAAVRRSRKSA